MRLISDSGSQNSGSSENCTLETERCDVRSVRRKRHERTSLGHDPDHGRQPLLGVERVGEVESSRKFQNLNQSKI